MNIYINNFINKLNHNNSPSKQLIQLLEKKIDFDADKDFIDFIHFYDGAEGGLSSGKYIAFWNIDDIIALNPYYKEDNECRKIFFFASDGSNYGYAFDKQTNNIVGIDFLDIGEEAPKLIANSFITFLKWLEERADS